ncbi:2TM domain-containing protein [Marixanthomonas spongiae]|uniref:2TM domain-containing protein n=1 Tax=Marixanthomonas spongiae TaxID=2174845 RepID=A0A2U0I3L7_9FLAO|nr:2TM domain-containing protein [Marixanthomonas spongiae]PVW15706.1 hypothetical protein DDV96_05390 [Marixanthomonas spongiae]
MDSKEKRKYERARKKVEEIKGFYTHLSIYLVINGLMLVAATGVFQDSFMPIHFPDWSYFTTPVFWGLAVFIHWFYVFRSPINPFKNWEERKIKQFMEEEENEFRNNSSSF